MTYSVEINRDIDSLIDCLQWINDKVDGFINWRININAGGIDYGIYFNFDIKNQELEICNQSRYDESLGLSEIIDKINEYEAIQLRL